MNCDKCQELVSAYLDGDLEMNISQAIDAHLKLCRECADLVEDFSGILLMCGKKTVGDDIPAPNPQAMWKRINNVIENEIQPEIVKTKTKKRWFAGSSWSFSFSQITTAILGITLISSLLTFVVLQNTFNGNDPAGTPPTLFQKVLSKIGLIETPKDVRDKKIVEQKAAIEYWNKRIEGRRNQWNANLRQAFDRNLHEIDQVVAEYTVILESNPQDDLTSEMLDSALTDKVDLLKEFSDL